MKKIFVLSGLVLIIIIFFINSRDDKNQEYSYIIVDNKSDSNLKLIWRYNISGEISTIKKIANYGFVPAHEKVIVMLPPIDRKVCSFSVVDVCNENKTGVFALSLSNICPVGTSKTYEISDNLEIS